MTKTILQGRLSHQFRSLRTLLGTIADVLARRALGRPVLPQWSVAFEIGTLFYRRRFDHALALPDSADGRAYFDQSHLCRETRRVTGFAPAELRSRIAEDESFWMYRIWT